MDGRPDDPAAPPGAPPVPPAAATPAPAPVPPPLVLAPLQGVTTAPFRRVFHRHFPAFDRALAPFLATTTGRLPPERYFRDLLPPANAGAMPLVPQLLGKDGAGFREMANHVHDQWGFDEVNWNIGCPSGTVTARGRGAGILPHPDRVDAFLEQACAGLRCRLSVKMRLGMERDDECLVLADVLNRFPLCEVTVHPRTGRQQYGGRVDVDRFAGLKALLRAPVAYNGDLRTPGDVLAICQRFPDLSSVMLGRGALSDPFLPGATRGARVPEGDARTAALARFHDDLYREHRALLQGGPGPVLAKMKEVWAFWGHLGPGVRRVLKARTLADYEEAVDRVFGGAA